MASEIKFGWACVGQWEELEFMFETTLKSAGVDGLINSPDFRKLILMRVNRNNRLNASGSKRPGIHHLYVSFVLY
jgi:hypothetical protein